MFIGILQELQKCFIQLKLQIKQMHMLIVIYRNTLVLIKIFSACVVTIQYVVVTVQSHLRLKQWPVVNRLIDLFF